MPLAFPIATTVKFWFKSVDASLIWWFLNEFVNFRYDDVCYNLTVSISLINLAFHFNNDILHFPFSARQVLMHFSMPSAIFVIAFSKSVQLLFLDLWHLHKMFCNLESEIARNYQLLCDHDFSIYCDPLQFHFKLCGFSKIASMFLLLDTQVRKVFYVKSNYQENSKLHEKNLGI